VKVLHVINGLGTGGAERSLAELLPPLRARGIDGVVACFHHRVHGVEQAVIDSGVDVRFVDATSTFARARAVRRIIAEVQPDIVHTTIYEADVAGRLAAMRTHVPVLTSIVNPSYGAARRADPNIRAWRLAAARLVDGWTARHLGHGFIAITAAVADAAVDALGIDAARVRVVHRGRNAERMAAASARADLDLPPDAEVLLHVGRQEFQKGIEVLVEALSEVRRRRPHAVLLQAGRDGSSTAAIQRLVGERSLREAVRLLGHRDDVPALLATADVFVFPSRFEGLGGSLVEAQAAGVAIVASDLPAVREVVDDGRSADLVPADDPGALASAIVAILEDDDRRRAYGERGRAIFAERFTLERAADRFADALRELAAR
jgi:glycosyltransferase involved in cell wall biosynthesis